MSIVFLLPTPIPPRPEADAYAQEIAALRRRFGGELLYIDPSLSLPSFLPIRFPRPLFGWQSILRLRRLAERNRLFQVYSPTLYAYPILDHLRLPVVFDVTGDPTFAPRHLGRLQRLAAITVADEEDLDHLRDAGLDNVHVVRSGIRSEAFESSPPPESEDFRILMASAPWTLEQFASKGVDALLEAVRRREDLSLVLLWRGLHGREIVARVCAAGLEHRVEIIDEIVEVSAILRRVHCTVNLASGPGIVKAYPHSLLESLAAGRPVLVSREIAMARYVARTEVGIVVEDVTAEALLRSIDRLRADYPRFCVRVNERGRWDFGEEQMVESFHAVYKKIDEGFP